MEIQDKSKIQDPLLDQPALFSFSELEMDYPQKAKKISNCLSEMLKTLMEQFNVSLTEVSRKSGIPLSTLSEWLNGKVGCQHSDGRLHNLAKVFNVTVDCLLYGIGEDSETTPPAIEEIYNERILTWAKRAFRKYGKIMDEKLVGEAQELDLGA